MGQTVEKTNRSSRRKGGITKAMTKKTYYNLWVLNFLFFFLGEIIIWLATHNVIALLGGVVAAFDFHLSAEEFETQ